MGIENFFLHYKNPGQFLYSGDDYIELFECDRKSVRKVDTFENVSILDITADGFVEMTGKFRNRDTGIILNSAHFIFNIFEFDKIPLREKLRNDLIDWKIKKVFPENIDQYEHDYFKLDKKHILSILFKRSLKEKIENLAVSKDVSITYLGNSTIEIMNTIFKGKQSPDFFIEIDKHLSIVVFQSSTIPFYIRKFRIEKVDDIIDELQKTLHFVESSYSQKPQTYALISNISQPLLNTIRDGLSSMDMREKDFPEKKGLFLPGQE